MGGPGEPALLGCEHRKYFGTVTALETSPQSRSRKGVRSRRHGGESTSSRSCRAASAQLGEYPMMAPRCTSRRRVTPARGYRRGVPGPCLAPLRSIWRNSSSVSSRARRHLMRSAFRRRTRKEMEDGDRISDVDQTVGTLGWRASVGGHRTRVIFGARVRLTSTPPHSVFKQSGVVLKYTRAAADRGLGVIFITHNPNHAIPVGDRFLLLNRGHSLGDFDKDEISRTELTRLMAGGAELEQLEHEIGIR